MSLTVLVTCVVLQVLYTVQMLCTVVELMVLAPNGEDGKTHTHGMDSVSFTHTRTSTMCCVLSSSAMDDTFL